ncbi:MAG: FkbM family methyltransferase [Bacteroidales bacterium]
MGRLPHPMKKLLAHVFRLLFRIPGFRRYHFALYTRWFKPRQLFRDLSLRCRYDGRFPMEVEVGEWIQQHVFFFGIYDEPGIRFVESRLGPGDVFLDVGANLGWFSLPAGAAVDPESGGLVHAFEPVRAVYDRLVDHLEQNGMGHVHPHRLAVGRTAGQAKLYLSGPENIGMSSLYRHDGESGRVERVELVSLDAFAAEEGLERVDLVKLDIEGGELPALKGMAGILERFRPDLLVEVSSTVLAGREEEGEEIFRFLHERGYDSFVLDHRGGLEGPTAGRVAGHTNYAFVYTQQTTDTP